MHESYAHMRYIWLNRKTRCRPSLADATVHVVPAALPASSMSKMATMAKMASATHVVLMATSVVADILMLYDDDGVDVVSNPEHAEVYHPRLLATSAYRWRHSPPSSECRDQ